HDEVVAAPGVVATQERVRLEGAAEVGHSEGRDVACDIQLLRRLIERGERRADLRQQLALQRHLSGVRVEVAKAAEEYLALNAKCGSYLNNLRNLLQLRGEPIVRREHGLERSDRLHRIHQGLRIAVC